MCLEGIVQSLLVFQGKLEAPKYSLTPPSQPKKLILDKSVISVRKHVIGAVLRGVTFNKARYNSFIDLQDKLHQNLTRKRTLASVGTRDLDTIQDPGGIRFVHLSQTKENTSAQLMELYSTDAHLKSYLPFIKDSPVYPITYDAHNVVLSLPPIIN